MSTPPPDAAPLFRVDRFVVPENAVSVFMERLRRTQRSLDAMPGCRQNLVLTRSSGPGRFSVITLVEWESEAAITAAQEAMRSHYADEGFNPGEFMQALDIQADLGLYRSA